MTPLSREQTSRAWASLLERAPVQARQRLRQVTERHASHLADCFYEQMLTDETTAIFLSHEQVKDRLHSSMQKWIISLFAVDIESDLEPVLAHQVHVGEVHARINVPVHLVLRGARYLKDELLILLQDGGETSLPEQLATVQLMIGVIDLAMEVMSHAYAHSRDRNARAGEAYRLFAIAQNLSTEKERQRAALLDWENQLMFDLVIGLDANQLPHISSAEFGLWFRHKGAHAFEGTEESQLIIDAMQRIDDVLLPLFDRTRNIERNQRIQYLRELREQSKSIGYHLERLFEQSNELEAGRDVLTQLLNRKFLPVVLSKEVSLAQKTGIRFAILAIDIDHFKQINDRYGHEAGDMVLQQVAGLLNNYSRSGDYLFRLGGEEFLIVLVDITEADAFKAAEGLRKRVATEAFRLPEEGPIHITISIGLALHDGHPDYQRTLRAADEALYQAKHSGRDRVVQADR